ncbi:MAG: DNA polymerase III subunit beta [Gammaproteobacteria bacterium]|nr:DNA polymerase III subunit beta [Gammaproteobacteria bacterium]
MKFNLPRDVLLRPIQVVNGVVERRQALPILANTLITLQDNVLALTATDMEVELIARAAVEDGVSGEVTVPARKLIDICRSLPNDADVAFSQEDGRVIIRAGRSRFTLSTLPADEYPASETPSDAQTVTIAQGELKRVIDLTQFAMANQDVRYYLNGLLFEFQGKRLRAVATDGHRLAMAELELDTPLDDTRRQLIVPRKGVLELNKLLTDTDTPLEIAISANMLRADIGDVSFSTKLVDGRFPDYERVVPDRETCGKHVVADRETVRQSLARASILSNEKYRAIRLSLRPQTLQVVANNPEQEEAEDEVEVEFDGEELEIGFNVSYLMDALTNVPSETVNIFLSDSSSSCLIVPEGRDDCQYVVMPMRL